MVLIISRLGRALKKIASIPITILKFSRKIKLTDNYVELEDGGKSV